MNNQTQPQFVVCINNAGFPASLEVRKLYQVLRDEAAELHSLVRVVDESGEDYLYPSDYFVAVELPQAVQQAILMAA
ncbi:MAG: hypothetical protein M3Y56_15905 [Armatimonadota bacterium]|nr:hypothetical protein [Armatimonadota bacterium]